MLKINPVYQKELKTGVRSMKIALILLGYNGFLALIGLFSFYLTFENSMYRSIEFSDILVIYTVIVCIEYALILFVVPALTSGSISGEREKQTLEILLTTKMKPFQIVIGKLAASISTLLMLVVSSLPILSITFAIGGIRFTDLFSLILIAFTTSVFIGSIGLFFSALFKRTTASTVFTYGTVILLVLGTIAVVGAVYLIISLWKQNNDLVQTPTDLGNFVLILLINPVLTLVAMLSRQFGSTELIGEFVNLFGNCNDFFIQHWFGISMIVQLLLSGLFLLGASKLLNPLKRKQKLKKK